MCYVPYYQLLNLVLFPYFLFQTPSLILFRSTNRLLLIINLIEFHGRSIWLNDFLIDQFWNKWEFCIPCIHPVVNYGINHGIWHGHPVERQENMLYIFGWHDFTIDELIDEIAMIGQPAHGKQHHHHDEHANHLSFQIKFL